MAPVLLPSGGCIALVLPPSFSSPLFKISSASSMLQLLAVLSLMAALLGLFLSSSFSASAHAPSSLSAASSPLGAPSAWPAACGDQPGPRSASQAAAPTLRHPLFSLDRSTSATIELTATLLGLLSLPVSRAALSKGRGSSMGPRLAASLAILLFLVTPVAPSPSAILDSANTPSRDFFSPASSASLTLWLQGSRSMPIHSGALRGLLSPSRLALARTASRAPNHYAGHTLTIGAQSAVITGYSGDANGDGDLDDEGDAEVWLDRALPIAPPATGRQYRITAGYSVVSDDSSEEGDSALLHWVNAATPTEHAGTVWAALADNSVEDVKHTRVSLGPGAPTRDLAGLTLIVGGEARVIVEYDVGSRVAEVRPAFSRAAAKGEGVRVVRYGAAGVEALALEEGHVAEVSKVSPAMRFRLAAGVRHGPAGDLTGLSMSVFFNTDSMSVSNGNVREDTVILSHSKDGFVSVRLMLTDGTALDRVIVSYSRARAARLNESVRIYGAETLNPESYTPKTTPHTLNPTPYTLNPQPQTPNPKPQTLHQTRVITHHGAAPSCSSSNGRVVTLAAPLSAAPAPPAAYTITARASQLSLGAAQGGAGVDVGHDIPHGGEEARPERYQRAAVLSASGAVGEGRGDAPGRWEAEADSDAEFAPGEWRIEAVVVDAARGTLLHYAGGLTRQHRVAATDLTGSAAEMVLDSLTLGARRSPRGGGSGFGGGPAGTDWAASNLWRGDVGEVLVYRCDAPPLPSSSHPSSHPEASPSTSEAGPSGKAGKETDPSQESTTFQNPLLGCTTPADLDRLGTYLAGKFGLPWAPAAGPTDGAILGPASTDRDAALAVARGEAGSGAVPLVRSVSPASAPAGGGAQRITVHGRHFGEGEGVQVLVGGRACTDVRVTSPTSSSSSSPPTASSVSSSSAPEAGPSSSASSEDTIECTAPSSSSSKGKVGRADVTVLVYGVAGIAHGAYRYGAPSLTALSPSRVRAAGGAVVTLIGTNFLSSDGGVAVTIDAHQRVACVTLQVLSDEALRCTLPQLYSASARFSLSSSSSSSSSSLSSSASTAPSPPSPTGASILLTVYDIPPFHAQCIGGGGGSSLTPPGGAGACRQCCAPKCQAWELSPDGNAGANGGAYHDVCERECAALCGGEVPDVLPEGALGGAAIKVIDAAASGLGMAHGAALGASGGRVRAGSRGSARALSAAHI
ncbi:hypothetical protein T484DRAFT_1937637 [Baffinella frigidus]|nr:hypothetical protein T484DRAFT_1937637 [Cryptophyta sp. CCMP2293]